MKADSLHFNLIDIVSFPIQSVKLQSQNNQIFYFWSSLYLSGFQMACYRKWTGSDDSWNGKSKRREILFKKRERWGEKRETCCKGELDKRATVCQCWEREWQGMQSYDCAQLDSVFVSALIYCIVYQVTTQRHQIVHAWPTFPLPVKLHQNPTLALLCQIPNLGKTTIQDMFSRLLIFDVCHLTSIVGCLDICIEHSKKLKAR